jgi:hypothetical protein
MQRSLPPYIATIFSVHRFAAATYDTVQIRYRTEDYRVSESYTFQYYIDVLHIACVFCASTFFFWN